MRLCDLSLLGLFLPPEPARNSTVTQLLEPSLQQGVQGSWNVSFVGGRQQLGYRTSRIKPAAIGGFGPR